MQFSFLLSDSANEQGVPIYHSFNFHWRYSMKHPAFVLGALLLVSAALLSTLSGCTAKAPATSQVERGKYLVMAGGCNDCHTPKVFTPAGPMFDTTRLLSGHPASSQLPPFPKGVIGPTGWGTIANNDLTAWFGPWGVSFAYNLTPDMQTGIGGWTEEMFIQTLREGVFMGMSRPILPPMPWQTIGQMTDDDLKAIFAYLKSVPPINNKIPDPMPPLQE
jgi:mono/diheme cytochrome c family protein